MSDIDFDELDKAVMSLMKDVKPDVKSADPNDTPETVLSIDATSTNSKSSKDAPATTVLAQVAVEPTQPVAEPIAQPESAAPIVRSGGRIMDVMKTSSPAPIVRPVSRQAAVITPPTTTISDMIAPTTDAAKRPVVDTQVGKSAVAVQPEQSAMPDPIDFTAMKAAQTTETMTLEEPATDQSPEPEPAMQSAPEPVVVSKPELTTPTPVSDYTPFIPDAKVEKRPLGMPVMPAETTPEPNLNNSSEVSGESAKPPTQLPDELDTDLVAIESGAADASNQEADDNADEKSTEEKKPLLAERPSAPGDTFGGQVQIPKQYHETVSSGDKEHVPIYDTAALHQPLTHPAKKPAGWLWIVWIIGIMLLGAGTAAALYYFHVF